MNHIFIVAAVFSLFLESWGAPVSSDKWANSTTFRFPNSLPNTDIQTTKKCNIKTGTCDFSSNSALVRTPDDLVRLEQTESQAIRKKFGAITGTAIDKYENIKADESMNIIVTIKEPEGIRYLDKTKNTSEDLLLQAQAISGLRPVVEVDAIRSRYGLEMKEKLSRRSFRTKSTKNDLKKIMFDKDIASIDEYMEVFPMTVGIPDLALGQLRPTISHSRCLNQTYSELQWRSRTRPSKTKRSGVRFSGEMMPQRCQKSFIVLGKAL